MKTSFSFLLVFIISLSLSSQITERIPFLDGNKYGYANLLGGVVIPAEYDEAFPFYGGAAKVKKDGFWPHTCLQIP